MNQDPHLSIPVLPAKTEIKTVEELRFHLASAVQVELSTVPLYLYAAYSIRTSGYQQWDPGMSAFRTIRSVVIEEMLHLCLARNLLVAIGGDRTLYDRTVALPYPTLMANRQPKLMLRLAPASTELVEEVFLPLEEPIAGPHGALSREQIDPLIYEHLGEFYAAIENGFDFLEENVPEVEIWGDAATRAKREALQYGRAYWNDDGGGKPIIVKDVVSARAAIKTIVEQGEGAETDTVPRQPSDPTAGLDELTHYAKFRQIANWIDGIGDVWPVPTNPVRADYEGDDGLVALATLFDAAYCYVLSMIDEIYASPTLTRDVDEHGFPIVKEPFPSPRYHLERTFLAAMGGLLYPIADLLVRQPVTKGKHAGGHAGPCFGFYEFDGEKKPELIRLCEAALRYHPSLGGDDGVLRLIRLLPPIPCPA